MTPRLGQRRKKMESDFFSLKENPKGMSFGNLVSNVKNVVGTIKKAKSLKGRIQRRKKR